MNPVITDAIQKIRKELENATVEVDLDAIETELRKINREVVMIEENLTFMSGLLAGPRQAAAVSA